MKNYLSRNNEVVLMEEGYIHKQFADKKECEKERKMYAQLQMLDFFPKVLNKGDYFIDFEYLGDNTLLDNLNKHEEKNDKEGFIALMRKLADVFERLHSYRDMEVVYRDVNFRNFILRNDKIYCVDLADLDTGEICQPLGETLGFLLTYDEAFTPFKFDCASELLSYYVQRFGYERWQYLVYTKRILTKLSAMREKYWNIESIMACIL